MTREDSGGSASPPATLVDQRRMYSWFDNRSDVISVWSVDGGYVAEIGGLTADWRESQNEAGSVAWTCWLAET